MPVSKVEREFVDHLVELMQSIGPVYSKSMFGGHGIFLDGLMFGLVASGTLYLKVDKETELEFKAKGLEAFTYQKNGKAFSMSYYQAPEETLEESEEMNIWANKAYGSALKLKKKK
ncbi:MAG: TfoX/Sxy family protein [Methylococcales bacterium]|jgi:DNA transformation protein and related proteins|nr:TfoX/Sxy family protein [Methylococcales bacterium]MBT7410745.1 TfoX/Sxy family protein [Methylococcales bacterium]